MRIPPRNIVPVMILALGTAACTGDTVTDPSTTGSGSSTTSVATSGTNPTEATTGDPPTTSEGSGGSGTEALTSTTGDPSSTSSTTTTGDTTSSTTTTGETTSSGDTTTSGDTTGEPGSSSTGAPPCGPGQPGPDADADSVPDECDVCPAGDDLKDGDNDGAADACDPCPTDNPDDSDKDGVCEGVDKCPGGDDKVDSDKDGIPDFCDTEVLITPPKPIEDHDVAGDGALVLVRSEAGSILVTCYNADRTVRRAEFQAGKYDAQGAAKPVVNIARDTQKVLVTWYDPNGGDANHRIAYSLLDAKCESIVDSKTAILVANAYMEFHDAAIDAKGNAVVSVSPSATYINWIDAAGVAKVQQEAFNINAVYGTHVALNQATGEGIVGAQVHSGNGIYYRRFKADGSWKDGAAVQIPVNYHYWYDGFTLGMNDKSEFVALWRSGGTTLDLRFFAADGSVITSVQRNTIDFEGWNGGHCYDSFRRRHQEIPLRGDNFVLGEVYNWITPQQNRTTRHFEYTPGGKFVVEDSTKYNLDEGLTIRVDQKGFSYLRDAQGVHILKDYP